MWTYRLHEALRRLGVKDARQPDLQREAVLQALVVGDVSHLASPVLAPTCWSGGGVGAAVGEYASYQVNALGTGGCWVRQMHWSSETVGASGWRIDSSNPLVADPIGTACSKFDMGPTPVESLVWRGTTTVNTVTPDRPRHYSGEYVMSQVNDGIYIPRGYWLTLACGNNNSRMDVALLIQDAVEQPPEA